MRSDGIDTASQTLGRAVRARRRALKLTQAELAHLAGCGLAFLYDLEVGKPSVRLDKVLDVLGALGLSLRIEPGRVLLALDPRLDSGPDDGTDPGESSEAGDRRGRGGG